MGYNPEEPIELKVNADDTVDAKIIESDVYPNILAMELPLKDGSKITVTDYSSAGKTWKDENKMAVWMFTK